MNIPVRHATAATKLAIVDCDIHPALRKPSDLYPFLPARWREHMTRSASTCGRACPASSPGRA